MKFIQKSIFHFFDTQPMNWFTRPIYLFLFVLTACAPEIRLTKTAIQSHIDKSYQDVYFYDRNWKGTTYEKAKYYRIISFTVFPSNPFEPKPKAPIPQHSGLIKGPIKDYYMSGAIQAEIEDASYVSELDDTKSRFIGKVTHYTRGGQVSMIGYFNRNSQRNGAWTTFDEAGNITGQVYFDNGRQVATPEQISSNQETTPGKQAGLFRSAAPPPAYTGPCACPTCFGKKGMICSECGGDGKKCGTENQYVTEWVNKSVSKPVSVSEYDYSCKCYRNFTRYRYTTEMVQERKLKQVSTCNIACTRCNQSGRLACISCSGSGKGNCN